LLRKPHCIIEAKTRRRTNLLEAKERANNQSIDPQRSSNQKGEEQGSCAAIHLQLDETTPHPSG
jgi:hypothetical protein